MKYEDVANISLLHIRIFLKCFRYRSYSRVADELHFTPSMISKKIHGLETIIGVKLFHQEHHKMIPTLSAIELYEGWNRQYSDILKTLEKAADAQKQGYATVRIGLLESTHFCADYIMTKLEDAGDPELLKHIQWERRDMHQLPEWLNEDRCDLVITWSYESGFFDSMAVESRRIFNSPDAVFVPRGHELFDKEITSFADFRKCKFLSLSPEFYPHYYQYLKAMAEKYGFVPDIEYCCGSTDSAKYNLSIGQMVYLAPGLLCTDWETEDIKKIELSEVTTGLNVFWKKAVTNPMVHRIVNIITH